MIFSSFKRRISRLRGQDERGSILILVALSALVIIGSAGLAVDVGRLYATKAELSRAVDAAALAGVLEFNGTETGLTNAGNKAEDYLLENKVGNERCSDRSVLDECVLTVVKSVAPEPCTMTAASAACIVADGGQSKLSIHARKETRLFFMPIFGINHATVSAKATAGFNDQTIDAAIVIDATGSMTREPVHQAKIAANDFKNMLLGTGTGGNVKIGINSFRGCWRDSSPSATYPMSDVKSKCAPKTEVTGLTNETKTLSDGINAICPSDTCTGGSGTNVCGGLAKGWEVLEGSAITGGNHRRFLVLLSDGDNNYNGAYTYQTTPSPESAHTYQTKPCRPPESCSNVGGDSTNASNPCRTGTNKSGSDGFLNGSDNSQSCGPSVKRERQVDMITRDMAAAIEADKVEIFVVAFGVCDNTPATIPSDSECASDIGNGDADSVADQRLLKCIASSTSGTNDHYYYAAKATDLPNIFTTIAARIAHRLTE